MPGTTFFHIYHLFNAHISLQYEYYIYIYLVCKEIEVTHSNHKAQDGN